MWRAWDVSVPRDNEPSLWRGKQSAVGSARGRGGPGKIGICLAVSKLSLVLGLGEQSCLQISELGWKSGSDGGSPFRTACLEVL